MEWQRQNIEIRNGIGIRLTAALLASVPITLAVFMARKYPEELHKGEKGAPWIVLVLVLLFLLPGLYLILAAFCYRLRVSRDGIEKTDWWGKQRLTWEQIASCRRVDRTVNYREWTALLLLNQNETVLMETLPPFMGTIGPGFAEEYEAALRLAERFLHERLAQGILHQQRIDEIKDGSLDYDQRPWPELPYIKESPSVSRETSGEIKHL